MLYFNPRSHKGSDPSAAFFLASAKNFNPRSHKGSDRSRLKTTQLCYNFNPRSHKGSDIAKKRPNSSILISIHAPTRGATLPLSRYQRLMIFQSTLPQGERQQYLTKKSFYPVKYYKNIQIRSKNLSLFHLFKTNSNFFVHYFWCESSGRFMCTIHSHQPLS